MGGEAQEAAEKEALQQEAQKIRYCLVVRLNYLLKCLKDEETHATNIPSSSRHVLPFSSFSCAFNLHIVSTGLIFEM